MPHPPSYRPVVLAVLDGFGENPHRENNAVLQAKTPTLDALKAQYPHGLINASEGFVGLPEGQMGNSEVGHMNIGSGRVVMQDLPRIDAAIADGSLAHNPTLQEFITALKKSGGACHLMGLLSPGGVHSHQKHMAWLGNYLTKQGITVWVHAFLDGRDTPPKSALEYITQFKRDFSEAKFATVSGRYYAMDRDNRWDRVDLAYHAMADGRGSGGYLPSVEEVIRASYGNNKTDEFVLPAIIDRYEGMRDGDGILMANFRADRVREILSHLLCSPPTKPGKKFAAALGMMEYSRELNFYIKSLFPPQPLTKILGEVVAEKGLAQLRIAETEKYAHVTFFFNGGREEPFPGEERILVPSPKVATYDLQPEMSAPEVTGKLVAAIESGTFDFIVVNYANCDMVGHTGNLQAAIKAVETVDAGLACVWKAVEAKGGALIVTADHGNAEEMHDEASHQAHTAHTLNLVPVIVASPALKGDALKIREGRLADIAPTALKLMGLAQPAEMTGKPLL